MGTVKVMLVSLSCMALVTAYALPGTAQTSEDTERSRPTIQQRFAVKENSTFGELVGMTHVRNDFYDSLGLGGSIGYYLSESTALELRWVALRTRLSAAADDVKIKSGLTPDARAQEHLALGGFRYSFGYGKMLVRDWFVVHFDPQWVMHGGVALAQGRVIPTISTGPSLLNHFRWGIHFKVDLLLSTQFEHRDRGWIPSFGFSPMVGIGWSYRPDRVASSGDTQ